MRHGLGRLVWAERSPYLLGSIFVLFSTLTALVYPSVVRLLMDDAITAGHLEKLNQLSLIMVGILVVEAAATVGRDYSFGLGAERVGLRLRTAVFQALLRQDIQFFDSRDVGEITTRLWADVPPLEHALGEELAEALKNVVVVIGGLVLLLYTSPWLTLLMLVGLPPIALASSWLGRRVKAMAADVQKAQSEAGAASTEGLAGVRTVRAFGQEPAELARFVRQLAQAFGMRGAASAARHSAACRSRRKFRAARHRSSWPHRQGQMSTAICHHSVRAARGARPAQQHAFGAEALRALGATGAFAIGEPRFARRRGSAGDIRRIDCPEDVGSLVDATGRRSVSGAGAPRNRGRGKSGRESTLDLLRGSPTPTAPGLAGGRDAHTLDRMAARADRR